MIDLLIPLADAGLAFWKIKLIALLWIVGASSSAHRRLGNAVGFAQRLRREDQVDQASVCGPGGPAEGAGGPIPLRSFGKLDGKQSGLRKTQVFCAGDGK